MLASNLSLLSLAVAILQLTVASAWFLLERTRPFVRAACALLVAFALINITEAGHIFFRDAAPVWSRLYAIVAPLLPASFFATVVTAFRPQWLAGRRGWLYSAVIGVWLTLVIADVVSGAGYYYTALDTPPSSMHLYINQGTLTAGVVRGVILFSIAIPWLMFLTGFVLKWNREERWQQVALMAAIILSSVLAQRVEGAFAQESTSVLSNGVLSLCLFLILLARLRGLRERVGAIGQDLPIGRKLAWGFGGLILVMLAIATMSSFAIAQLNRQVQAVLVTQNQIAQTSTALYNRFSDARRAERDYPLVARTEGIEAATEGPYQRWVDSMADIAWLLDATGLQSQPLSPAQRERVRTIIIRYDLYYDEVELYFNSYIQRGDNNQGAVNEWIQQAQFVDTLLNSDPVTSRDFNTSLVSLRNLQFYYLTTQDERLAAQIRAEYDALQEQILFAEIDTPMSLRVNLQQAVETEALGFDGVRASTRNIAVREESLEGAAANLGLQVQSLTEQVNAEFSEGVAELDRQRLFYVVVIVTSSVVALLVALFLAALLSRQITRPVAALAVAANRMGRGELGVRASVFSRDEIGVAARSFNAMATSLDDLLRSLEARVQERTAQLETAAQVASEAAGRMAELQALLDLTTGLIVERFPTIYHAQVFLIDQEGEGQLAILRSSTGEAGKQLLARQHRLGVGSQSVIGRTTGSGQHVLARTDDPGSVHRPNELLPETKAELALPMRRGDRIIGALDVQSKTADAFGPDDIQVLQILADQLTVAVENARLFRDANLSLQETSRLFTASSRIATAQSRDEVLDTFSDAAAEADEFDRLTVLFFTEFDAQGRPMLAQSVRTWSRDEGITNSRYFYDVSSVNDDLYNMVETGGMELPDLAAYDRPSAELQKALSARGTQSALLIPLVAAGNYLGMILMQRRAVGAFLDDVKRTFQLLAQQASVALNRFVLLDELTVNVEDLRKIRESFLDISSATTLERLYTQMAPRAASLMRARAAAIYAYDEANDLMRLVAQSGIEPRFLGEELRRGEGAAGHLIERREPFTLQNYAASAQPAGHFGAMFGPVIAAPLLWQEQLLGAIVAANPSEEAPFAPDDRDRLVLFTDQAALAIQNTRLLDTSTRSLREQRQLYQSTQALLGAGREEALIAAIAGNLSEGNSEIVAVLKATALPQALVVAGVNDAQWEANTFPKAQYRYAADLFPVGSQIPARLLLAEGTAPGDMAPRRLALDSTAHELAQSWHQLHGFRHLIVVPIFVREGFWGAILQLRREAQSYTREDEIRVSTVANQFAVALDNIQLLAQSRHAAEQLTTAAEVSRVASSMLDVEVVLNRAVNLIRERFGHYHVQVFLLDEAGEWAELRASTGHVGARLLERKHRLAVGSQSVIGQVTSERQHVLARSASVDRSTVHRFNELLPETRTELALPMVVGGRVVGALDVQSVHADAFSDGADIGILQSLADQLAVAVENARLYQESQVSAEDNKALYTASRAINESRNSDEVARAIATYIVQEPGAVVSLVRLNVDANEIVREADVIGDSRPSSPERRLRAFTARTLPILQKLDLAKQVVAQEALAQSERLGEEEKRLFRLLGTGALLSVPLRLPGGWTGLILVTYPAARAISRREINRLTNITTQTATTLQNRDLLHSTEQSLEESRLLYEAGAAINAAGATRGLLEAMVPLAAEMEPAQVVMMLFEEPMFEGARPIRLRVEEGVTLHHEIFAVGSTWPARDLPLFRNLPVSATVAIEDAHTATHLSERERGELRAMQLRSMLYLPLQVGNRYLGYIGFNMTGPATLRDNLIQRLQTVVQQAAIALQTQQYTHQAQRRAWREEQIARITAALNSASDPDEVLRIGLQELKETLNVRRAAGWIEPSGSGAAPALPKVSNGKTTNGLNGHH